jgi:hypothetical protein
MAAATDAHTVLVVHGVTHRTPDDFRAEIAELADRLAPRRVEPVFWGDLGPGDVQDAYPVAAAATELGKDTAAANTPTTTVVREELDNAAASGTIFESVRGGLRRIVSAVDARLDQVAPETLTDHLRHSIARTVRDVEAYERNGAAIRARLDAAYRAAVDEAERVDVIAHSLGALVAVEWLYGAPAGADASDAAARRVDTLVTLGSQVALFCEVRGLQGATTTAMPPPIPVPIALPLRRWANVWHTLDPLAFAAAPVLEVTGRDGPVPIDEYRLDVARVPTSASFHSAYWRDDRVLSWLPRVL